MVAIPEASQRPVRLEILGMGDMAGLAAVTQAEDRITRVRGRAHQAAAITALLPAADRTEEVIQVAGLTEVPLTTDIHPPGMTAITDRFSPRFTSHLTHRREASKGASCPPRRVTRRKRFRKMRWLPQPRFPIQE